MDHQSRAAELAAMLKHEEGAITYHWNAMQKSRQVAEMLGEMLVEARAREGLLGIDEEEVRPDSASMTKAHREWEEGC